MKRREVVRIFALSTATLACGYCQYPIVRKFIHLLDEDHSPEAEGLGEVHVDSPVLHPKLAKKELTHEALKDARTKSTYFSQDFPDDIYFSGRKLELVQSLAAKFRTVQRLVGFGNFNVMGMDEFFRRAAGTIDAGALTAEEKLFLEEIFSFDAKNYGFQGEKTSAQMTDTIDKNSVLKIPGTGHFLRKGPALETYTNIIKDVGNSVVLTSGVRGLAKQYHLFFEQALQTKGNMSRASRSLAPPGYSFHGHADFDIGKRGFGLKNFTSELASSDEYKKLLDLGYVHIRYTESNALGVRFEPWHIKVHES
jgi:hypothetical protein